MEQWLIRTASGFVAGPYPRPQIIELIQSGKLGLQDEVCCANGYWVSLHEYQEVERQLGIRMPRAPGDPGEEEEITETQTESVKTQTGLQPILSASLPGTPRSGGSLAPQEFAPRMRVSPSIETPSIWRGLAWVLVVMICGIVVAVLRILRSSA
ncbi:hypothetical protein WDW37_07135 [Bdellovibrionota bacterium FG-1]